MVRFLIHLLWEGQKLPAALPQAGALIAPWVLKGAIENPAFTACVEKGLVSE